MLTRSSLDSLSVHRYAYLRLAFNLVLKQVIFPAPLTSIRPVTRSVESSLQTAIVPGLDRRECERNLDYCWDVHSQFSRYVLWGPAAFCG